MKKNILKIALLLLISLSILSCSKDEKTNVISPTCDDGIQNGNETGIDCGGSCRTSCIPENNLEGVLVTRMVLHNNIDYKLTGPFIVRDGAILEIEAGTVIKALKGKNAYIVVAQGGKIYVWGKENNPVVITSDADNPTAGDWGGIVICGKAPTNNGENARSELVDIFYGGTDSELTSGVIKYLRLEYTGENFENIKPFNALTFYGVGSFTTVENIQAYESLGNGFELVGGTVNVKQLISTNVMGSSIKIYGGWNGSGNSWYLNSGIELGNNKNELMAMPLSSGNIDDISIIGPLVNSAINYTDGGGVFDINNVYTSNINLGINITSSTESSMIDNGNLNINNIEFDSPGNDFTETNYSGTTNFYNHGSSLGAGNKNSKPNWANNWATGF